MKSPEDNQYDIVWLAYFTKSLNLFNITYPAKFSSKLIKSIKDNRAEFFKPTPIDIKLFETIKIPGRNKVLLEHLSVFKKDDE